MSYKRVVQKRGKSYGPYIYESYRDEHGNVKKRYLGKVPDSNSRRFSFIPILVVLLFLIVGVGIYSTISNSKNVEQSTSIFGKITGFASNSFKQSANFISSFISGKASEGEEVEAPAGNLEIPTEPVEETPIENQTPPAENLTLENQTEILLDENQTPVEQPIENQTPPAENLTNETLPVENLVLVAAQTTKQFKAVIGRPVKWIKVVKVEAANEALEIPKEAESITIKTGAEVADALDAVQKYSREIQNADKISLITGQVTIKFVEKKGIITRILEWLGLRITGKVIYENELGEEIVESEDSKIIELGEIAQKTGESDIAVEYYTEAPVALEENIAGGKRVTISAADELGYTDILAYSQLENKIKVGEESRIKLLWKTNGNKQVDFETEDLDSDGYIDYIEWNVPHLSNQTYEIIYISNAVKLDTGRNFVSDVYEQVKAQDGTYESFSDGEYLRVTFEQELDSSRDITVYARGNCNGTIRINDIDVPCDIYYKKLRLDLLKRENG